MAESLPRMVDTWRPCSIRADSDISFDQGAAPLREVDGLRRDPLRRAFVGVQSKGSVQFCIRWGIRWSFAGVLSSVYVED